MDYVNEPSKNPVFPPDEVSRNPWKLKNGERVWFTSDYIEGDLIKFRYQDSQHVLKESYSKIVKIIPKFEDNTSFLKLYFLTENKKFVAYCDVISLEKKGSL